MNAFRLILAVCAAVLIGLEVWDTLVRGDDLNWLLVVAMALLMVSMYLPSKATDRWRTGTKP